ncbi:hypothetical protein TWF718_003402 [Orbilia javanica]|uniref:F-box domain-containing protein n=1 Tax=Orbilia javanica TaxID=47235 RepID=A0AAN8ML68_9PEZI
MFHCKVTQSIKESSKKTEPLSWLPSTVLSRIFDRVDAFSLLALAVTSVRLLKLTAPYVREIIMPRHIGSWAGSHVQYVHLVLDDNLHRTIENPTSEYIENHMNYQIWTKGYKVIEPPRGICFTLDYKKARQAGKILVKIMEHATKYPSKLAAIGEFIQEIQYGDEFWLSFSRHKRYWFYKKDSLALQSPDITVFDLPEWADISGSSTMDRDSLPSSVFRRGMYFMGDASFFAKSNWAGEAWGIMPYEDLQDELLGLTPLQRGQRRHQMIQDIFNKDKTRKVLSYLDYPESDRRQVEAKQKAKTTSARKAAYVALLFLWSYQTGVLSELWYYIGLGWWVFTGFCAPHTEESLLSTFLSFFSTSPPSPPSPSPKSSPSLPSPPVSRPSLSLHKTSRKPPEKGTASIAILTMVCKAPDSWDTSSSSTTALPTPPSPQPPGPSPTPNAISPTPLLPFSGIPQWNIEQINPNLPKPSSSCPFNSHPKDKPPTSSKSSQSRKTSSNQKQNSQNRVEMGRNTSDDPKSDIERIHQILSTTLMSQKYATSFHQQQICTQPTSRTYTFDDANEDGVLHIAIDAEQRLKDVTESCNSCETLGDQMSKIVHGQCVELFRIRCDTGENGERQIQGLELDLRQIKRPEVGQTITDSQSARIKLLEARMRGTDSSIPPAEEDNLWPDNDREDDLGSIRLLRGIKSISGNHEDRDGEKRRRLSSDGELTIKTSEEANLKDSKNADKKDDKSRALTLIPKPVSLIQPRSRSSKQGSSIQMMPQPKKSKKKKNKKQRKNEGKEDNNAIEITRILTPIESITIYDAPNEGDISLRNPQSAWAQRQGDELTITQRGEQLSSNSNHFLSADNVNDVSNAFYCNRVDNEREKYRNIYSVQPPRERPRTNVFILYSTEDEKASTNHRPDIFTPTTNENTRPMPMAGSIKPIEPGDVFENTGTLAPGPLRPMSNHETEDTRENNILLDQASAPLTHEGINNEIAAAMETLKSGGNKTGNLDIEATLDVLRRDQERVSAEINRLLEVQERAREQDREIDRLIEERNIQPSKYRITEPGQEFSLSQTLDDLIDLGAENAPSFEPKSPELESHNQITFTPLHMPSEGCQQPTQQQRQEWLDSINSSSTSGDSARGSESDPNERLEDINVSHPKQEPIPPPNATEETEQPVTIEEPVNLLDSPALERAVDFEAGISADISTHDIPTALPHPGPIAGPAIAITPPETLENNYDGLSKSVTRKSGKKQKIKHAAIKKEWTPELQESFETSCPQGRRRVDGVKGTIIEICDNDSSVSGLSTPEEIEPTPDVDTPVAAVSTLPETFAIPVSDFTVKSDLGVNTKIRKPTAPEGPLRLKVLPKTPLKSILKKTSQFEKLTDEKPIAIEPAGRKSELGERPKVSRGRGKRRSGLYAKIPFPDTPFTSVSGITVPGGVYKASPAPQEGPNSEIPTLTDEQQYQNAVAKLSELPGFVEQDLPGKDIPPTDTNESKPEEPEESEESEEETEEEKERRRAIKGKAVDRDNWLGSDCRFFEYPPHTPFEIRPPSPRYPPRPVILQDDIILARAIHEAFVEVERQFAIEKQQKMVAEAMASRAGISDVDGSEVEAQDTSLEKMEIDEEANTADLGPCTINQNGPELNSPTAKLAGLASMSILPNEAHLSGPAVDEEEDDPFAPAEERARREAEKAKF